MKNSALKKLLLLFSLTIFFFACKKENTISSTETTYSEIVSIETARKVALGFAQKHLGTSTNQNARTFADSSKKIKSQEIIGDLTNPYFYIFNFENKGGFVIVSAEKNEHPILAYSEKGEFKKDNAPYGIISWIETTKENIDYIRQGKFNTKKQTSVEWALIGKDFKIPSLLRVVDPDPICQDYSTNTTIGPLIATEWGQGCGYNALCPTNTSGFRCGHFPTGCVATAMAQVMRYWQTPATTYNWASMPNTFADNEVARLMRDAGSSVNMDYNDNGSGAKHEDIPPAMINTFTFSSAQNINYSLGSYSTVQSELNSSRPVILSGYNTRNTSWFGLVVEYQEGHEWVCDGFQDIDVFWCNPDGTQGGAGYLYFHMNWGWDGTSNGWYAFDNWAPSGTNFNFQYYRRAIINIHP